MLLRTCKLDVLLSERPEADVTSLWWLESSILSFRSRAPNASENLIGDRQTPPEVLEPLFSHDTPQNCQDRPSALVSRTDQQDARMRSGLESPDIAEVEIERNQESPLGNDFLPYGFIGSSRETFVVNAVGLVSKLLKESHVSPAKVLIQLDSE